MEQYFATLPSDQIGGELKERVERYYEHCSRTRRYELWRKVYRQYYAGYFNKGSVEQYGKQGEKRLANINIYKNVLQRVQAIVTSQRPEFEPKAVNSDYESRSQTIIAKGLLDYYMRRELENPLYDTFEKALKFGEGYMLVEWDDAKGEIFGEDIDIEEEIENMPDGEVEKEDEVEEESKVVYTGDIAVSTYNPIDIIRDYKATNVELCDWFIVRKWENRFNLAEKYPKFKEEIVNSANDNTSIVYQILENDSDNYVNGDLIPVYKFIHKKTPAVPNGREVLYLDCDTVIFDGDLQYENMNLYPLILEPQEGTCFAYTIAFDLLSTSQIYNMLHSTITTNHNAFGAQNILVPKGSDINVSQIAEGVNIIYYNSTVGRPEPLQMLASSPESYNYAETMKNETVNMAGLNEVSMGQVPTGIRSGNALALLQSMAIQFQNNSQRSWVRFLESIGTGLIEIFQRYATAKRVIDITGKSNRMYLQEFNKDDISNITKVNIDVGNALMRTTAGRLEVANNLMQNGLVKTPQEYLTVLATGVLDPLVEGDIAELNAIKEENENLSNGMGVQAVITEDHRLHIQEHKAVLSNPASKENVTIVQAVLGHLQEHIDLLSTPDPMLQNLLMTLGQQPIAPMMPPPNPMNGQPQEGIDPATMEQPQGNAVPQAVEDVNMPNNPLSNEDFNPEDGGI